MYSNRTYAALTYAGAIPFLACALLLALGVETLGALGSTETVLSSYGLAIICFLCGTQWAAELQEAGRAGIPLFPLSNLIVLATWIANLLAKTPLALLVQVLAILALLAIDGRLHRAQVISQHYWTLRKRISAIVAIALLLGLVGA